jgi:hypothetical protein
LEGRGYGHGTQAKGKPFDRLRVSGQASAARAVRSERRPYAVGFRAGTGARPYECGKRVCLAKIGVWESGARA